MSTKSLIAYPAVLSVLLFLLPPVAGAGNDFSFDMEEFEKKPLEWGGYVELKCEHIDFNEAGSLYQLGSLNETKSQLDRITGSVQLDGSYTKGIASFNWTLKAAAAQDNLGWEDMADIYEAYAHLKPTSNITVGTGKKSYKWGKGYAWNPVGFVNRPKDPNNPEEALEGYTTLEADLVKSLSGSLQTAALTTLVLPVWEDINEDFGVVNNVNLAAKLYLLYLDTDIDFLFYTGNSRSNRFGIDFSKNLATNFEIHGELAYISNQKKTLLGDDGTISKNETSHISGLVGLRYLSKNDITSIIEYYHNGAGYTKDELEHFYQFVDEGTAQFFDNGNDSLLEKAKDLSLSGYGRPYLGRNYLYAKLTQKEPFDILYCTPGLTAIVNLDDLSSSVSPEIVYTGFTNWELRLRFSYLSGGNRSEYGEKQNSSKLEARIRYFF